MAGKKQKIEIAKRETKEQRVVTFSKRKKGLFKKAAELSVLSGASMAIFATSPAENRDRIHSFYSNATSAYEIANRFLNNEIPSKPEPNPKSMFWWENLDTDWCLVPCLIDQLQKTKNDLMASLSKKIQNQTIPLSQNPNLSTLRTQIPNQIPNQNPNQIPNQIPNRIPIQIPIQIPSYQIPSYQIPNYQIPNYQIPNYQIPDQNPNQITNQTSNQIPNQIPIQIPNQIPNDQIPNHQIPNYHIPAQISNQITNQTTNQICSGGGWSDVLLPEEFTAVEMAGGVESSDEDWWRELLNDCGEE